MSCRWPCCGEVGGKWFTHGCLSHATGSSLWRHHIAYDGSLTSPQMLDDPHGRAYVITRATEDYVYAFGFYNTDDDQSAYNYRVIKHDSDSGEIEWQYTWAATPDDIYSLASQGLWPQLGGIDVYGTKVYINTPTSIFSLNKSDGTYDAELFSIPYEPTDTAGIYGRGTGKLVVRDGSSYPVLITKTDSDNFFRAHNLNTLAELWSDEGITSLTGTVFFGIREDNNTVIKGLKSTSDTYTEHALETGAPILTRSYEVFIGPGHTKELPHAACDSSGDFYGTPYLPFYGRNDHMYGYEDDPVLGLQTKWRSNGVLDDTYKEPYTFSGTTKLTTDNSVIANVYAPIGSAPYPQIVIAFAPSNGDILWKTHWCDRESAWWDLDTSITGNIISVGHGEASTDKSDFQNDHPDLW